MRVLVCGGRDYFDAQAVFAVLDKLHAEDGITAIIHGDARGADRLAGSWARSRGVSEWRFPANWRKFGSRAGPIRNVDMLRIGKPAKVVAFPGGIGTAHMVNIAFAAGLPILRHE